MLETTRLSKDEAALVRALTLRMGRKRAKHAELDRYYRGTQQVQTLGLAVPPELRGFEFPLNWCRVTVDSIENRQEVKALIRPGDDVADEALQEGWAANNLDSEQSLLHNDILVQGEGFVSVSTNDDDKDHPLIRVESPKNMVGLLDQRHRRFTSCLRLYSDPYSVAASPEMGTLYLPDSTIWLQRGKGGRWEISDRDDHGLGRVPIVWFLNRRRSAGWVGETEMADVMRPVDMAARALMNLQVAMETHSVPGKWAIGVNKSDFIDASTGEMNPTWKAYYTAIMATANKDARYGQFAASDLKNFVEVIVMLAQQVSAVTGLPARYLGQNPANPAAEGAIRADESRLVKNVERKNRITGDGWGWVMALYERFRTGDWPDGNQVAVEWHDPGTPTFAQKSDALQKLSGGVPIISREGSWDELGWSEPRKGKEREYFRRQMADLTWSDTPGAGDLIEP